MVAFLNGSERVCRWPRRRRSGFHAADIGKKKKKAEKDPQCLLPDVLAPSGKDFLILLPFVTSLFFLVFSPDITRFPHLLHLCAPALFLLAPPPFCSPWCKVVILISLSPADHSPLYLSNYLSASSPPSHPAIHPICLYVKYLHLL